MATPLRRRRAPDIWPGFVDALASLLMVMVFVLLIFVIGQFVLTDAVSGRDKALAQLNRELAGLAATLSLETEARKLAERSVGELGATLARLRDEHTLALTQLEQTRTERDTQRDESARLTADLAGLQALKQTLEEEVARLAGTLRLSETARTEQAELSARTLAQVELLNRQLAAVREQLEFLNAALAVARKAAQDKDLRIDALGRELNLALAARVKELDRYRSEFFGRLRTALGERQDIQIVGDRFVFSSEVLFPSASDEVSEEGLRQLLRLAETLKSVSASIPGDLPWVLQVDGHTDRRPIATARFPSNWELSTARALAIVRFLRSQGIAPERLAATGYGEFHPLDARDTPQAYERNRRIELKLTNR